MSTTPPATVAGYTHNDIEAIVAARCADISARLRWPVAAPAVRVLAADALTDAVNDDVRRQETKARGVRHDPSLLERMTSFLASLVSPATLGYFAAGSNTLFLNGALVPAQAGSVLLHELVHAAQWQHAPQLFAACDAARVAAIDTAHQHGDESAIAKAARDRFESLVTFLEGRATFHGRHALEDRLLREIAGANESDVRRHVDAMMALDLADENTQLIDVRGEKAIASLDDQRIDALFHDPDQIVSLFTRIAAA